MAQGHLTQREGIDRLIKAGALTAFAGPMMVPVPTAGNTRPAVLISQNGPCGNPGDWCSGVFTTLPGWTCKLCASCEGEWRKAVGLT